MISPWIIFIVAAGIVVYAANKLAEYGDVIAVRTGLGGLFVGTIFLAAATSLPELIASITSFRAGLPDLAGGNFFGSNMVNMFLLAIVDLVNYQVPLLRRVAITHTLTAALGVALMAIAVIFVMADREITIGWVGIESLILIVLYFAGAWLVQKEGQGGVDGMTPAGSQPAPNFPTLRKGIIGFAIAAIVLVAVVPALVQASADIAEQTGLGTSFVGTALLSVVTSLPELLAAYAAVRIGATDLAVGNLFGSSVFNMLGIGIADFFYTEGSFLNAIGEEFALVGMLGLFLTVLALIGNIARVERRFLFIEIDAVVIIIVYLLGLFLLLPTG